ncbi:MAG: helix-turn-helix domain-containing protein [Candidatus Omnitrophota bacterium]
MKNTYKQLSSEERDKIAVLRAQRISFRAIAKATGRNKSAICRELRRNSAFVYNVYLPHRADARAKEATRLVTAFGKSSVLERP